MKLYGIVKPEHFIFSAKLWLYEGEGSWHFVTLPVEVSKEIDHFYALFKRGWGSLAVKATIGSTVWETSIFSSKKSKSYILPIKKEVRISEVVKAGDCVNCEISIKE